MHLVHKQVHQRGGRRIRSFGTCSQKVSLSFLVMVEYEVTISVGRKGRPNRVRVKGGSLVQSKGKVNYLTRVILCTVDV